MKKLLFLFVGGAMSVAANAQSIDNSVSFKVKEAVDNYNYVNVEPRVDISHGTKSGSKTTASQPRWYYPFEIIDALNSGALEQNRRYVPLWYDSTVLQRFTSGLDTINYTAMAQIIDPIGVSGQMFNDASFNNQNIMRVNSFDSYTVDSVVIGGAYVKVQSRPTNIVDTLVVSIAPNTLSGVFRKATAAWISDYTTADSLVVFTPRAVDSVNRAAFSDVGDPVTGRVLMKIPLTDADRDTINTQNNTITVRTRTFALPSPLTIPAGSRVSVTVAFKSGDTWTPYVDTFNSRHHFRPQSACRADNQKMIYNFYTNLRDRNQSSMMFSTAYGFFGSVYAIEGTNPNSNFSNEHHAFGVHVVCPSCWVLDVKNTEGLLVKGGAYPNPSVSFVNVPFELSKAADVNISLTNTMGQVVMSQQVANQAKGEVTFNTSALTNGMYLYTIEVNGQRTTGRFTVAH